MVASTFEVTFLPKKPENLTAERAENANFLKVFSAYLAFSAVRAFGFWPTRMNVVLCIRDLARLWEDGWVIRIEKNYTPKPGGSLLRQKMRPAARLSTNHHR